MLAKNSEYIDKEVENGDRKGIQTGEQPGSAVAKKFRVRSKELEIEKRGNEIILREKPFGMERAFYLLTELVNLDALKNRKNDKPQKRKGS